MDEQEYYKRIFEESADAIVLADARTGEILDLNPAMERLSGWTRAEAVGRHHMIWHPDEPGEASAAFEKFRSGSVGKVLESTIVTRIGEARDVAINAASLEIGGRRVLLGFFRDISESKRMERSLVESGQQLRLYARIFEQSGQGVVIAGPRRKIVAINSAVTRMTGFSREDLVGRKTGMLAAGLHDIHFYRQVWRQVRKNGYWQGELCDRRKDGSLFSTWTSISAIRDEEGGITHYIAMLGDLSDNRAFEERINQLAYFDPLTGLPNRMLLSDRTGFAIRAAEREQGSVALLALGLDRFRNLNDTLGYPVGDRLLRQVAARLGSALRQEDTVSRLGGDEFHLLLPGCDADAAANVARKLHAVLSTPIVIDGLELEVSASIGISVFPGNGPDFESLLKSAETAMYRAKEEGRNRTTFYDPDMALKSMEALAIENALRHALERGEFSLDFQPRVNLKTGKVVGAEALLRWDHPELGPVPPERFIPVAEEIGMIPALGGWVLSAACGEAKRWMGLGHDLSVSVSVTARQLMMPGFVESVGEILRACSMDGRCLELELVEASLLSHRERIASVLNALKPLGIRILIDDFGSGYSSLGHLRRFPIDAVKIGRAFVADIVVDPDDEAIVNAIISMAHDLKLDVVAEGVDAEEQRAVLISRGCDEIQGACFSEPLPAAAMGELLASGKQLAPMARASAPALLLLDDEENILNSLVRLLRRDGYRILKTTSAKTALEFLAREEVGVILSDQRMPEMDGVSFLRRAKRLHPDSIRMVLSGYTDLNSVTDAINEGAVYKFLTKPWDDDRLRETIREAFQSYGIRRDRDRLMAELAAANEALSRSKEMLERLVDDKTLETLRTMDVLRISQDMLEGLPIGLIGADESGMIVLANRRARDFFGEVMGAGIGGLPAAIADGIRQALMGAGVTGKIEGLGGFRCHPFGNRGVIVMIRGENDVVC